MKDLIKKLDGAELFLRNRAKAKPAPLTEYDVLLLMDISNLICEAIRELERLTSLNNELEAKFNTCSKRFYKEGIKEFAERLKKDLFYKCGDINYTEICDIRRLIDNLVKEMVGERE